MMSEDTHARETLSWLKDRSRIIVNFALPQPNIIICTITDVITADTAPVLSAALARPPGGDHARHLIIDLSAMTSLDADGLYTLLVARHRHRIGGVQLAVVLNPHSRTIAELYLVSLQASFEVYDSLAAAFEACANTPTNTLDEDLPTHQSPRCD
jgi:anti-anti-sigma regulatory factor